MSGAETKDNWERYRDLMCRAQTGDQEAYQKLLKDLYPLVHNFLRIKFGRLGPIEDWTQECLMAVHKARHTYRSEEFFRPWFYAVIRYKSIDLLRKQQRVSLGEVLDNEKVDTFSADLANTINAGSEDLRHAGLAEALEELPVNLRRAVELTKLQGLSTREAAKKEGIKEAAIRTRISRAYKLLREKMERDLK